MSSTPETRTAILTILDKRATWMTLVDLRSKFGTAIARENLDAAILDLVSTHSLRLIPESNQKTLTEADRAAALRIGGKDFHLLHRNDY